VAYYCLVGIPLFGFCLGQVANVFMKRYTQRKTELLLSKKMTQEEFDFACSLSETDGKIDFGEFVMLSMLRLGSLDVSTLTTLKASFAAMDGDGSGKLEYAELVKIFDYDGDGALDAEPAIAEAAEP
jgi:Ca2+-binding EF-hand superfamily protein